MNLHQNALECNINIQNTPLILEIPDANIFCSEVESSFSNLHKYDVETIFSDNILVFSYNIVRPTNYFPSIKIEGRNNLFHHFFLNKLLAALRTINEILEVFAKFKYFRWS